MANKRYYWLKLKTDFFLQPKIRKMRSLENGSDLTIIYLKMQLLSIENEGVIYLEGLEDSIESELELLIDENVELIKKTIDFLKRYKLLEIISNDELHLLEIKESIGSECNSTERVRKHREKKKMLQCNNTVTDIKQQVTNSNTEIEIEIEIEKEIDIESREKSERERKDSNNVTGALPDVTNRYIDIEKEIDSREKSERKDSNTLTQLDFDQYTRKFYELYDMYPNHEYKEKALKYWLEENYDIETIKYIEYGVKSYSRKENTNKTFYYFLVDEVWKDYVEEKKQAEKDRIETIKIAKEIGLEINED